MAKIRIGIDVGGTFTHAVAVNDSNLKLVGQEKVKTTHKDRIGVARGVINSLKLLLKRNKISPKNIVLVAHSTTQATNAMLEGDVSSVGLIVLGSGLSGYFVKLAINISSINLQNGKSVKVFHKYYDIGKGISYNDIRNIIIELQARGAGALVIAEAFSTEDSGNERKISELAQRLGTPCTATSEISGLYGLKMRTKTAIVNASILPKMIETAEKTESAIRSLKISAPIMVVRSDGGILSLNEMKKRPILTILSGPAAGVGAALFYEKITDGIFIEVGGTSTDISVITDGASRIRPAILGGNRLYLKTLDVKTLGIAGGSIPRTDGGNIFDVGPRSAHIAGVDYASFSKIKSIKDQKAEIIQPKFEDHHDYLAFAYGKKFYTITPTCAANYLGLVKASDWAFGNRSSIKNAFRALENISDKSSADLAKNILDISSEKLEKAVAEFVKEYELDPSKVKLIGGGGGAAALVPYLAKKMKLKFKLSKDQAVISAIGATMSMVHEEVERSIPDPTEKDILDIKNEAYEKVVAMGALPGTVNVEIFVDKQRNLVRASSFGSLQMKKRKTKKLDIKGLKNVLLKEGVDKKELALCGKIGRHIIFKGEVYAPWFLFKRKEKWTYVLSKEGNILRSIKNASNKLCSIDSIKKNMKEILEISKKYGDAGAILPKFIVVFPDKITDLSNISDSKLMETVIDSELSGQKKSDKVAIIWKLM